MDSDISIYEMHSKIRDSILQSYQEDDDEEDPCHDKKSMGYRRWFRNRSVSTISASTHKSWMLAPQQPGLMRIAGKLGWFVSTADKSGTIMNQGSELEHKNDLQIDVDNDAAAVDVEVGSILGSGTTAASASIPAGGGRDGLYSNVSAFDSDNVLYKDNPGFGSSSSSSAPKAALSEKTRAMSALLSKGTNIRSVYRTSDKFARPKQLHHPNRVVVVSGIPRDFGINMVLSQVCGGPLERVVVKTQGGCNVARLFFVFAADADNFYHYARASGLFEFNGIIPQTEWASYRNTEDYVYLEPIPRYLMHQITSLASRRVLILTKKVSHKKCRTDGRLYYPNPVTHLSHDLDIAEIRHDFGSYGEVVEIGPVVSRKLCFSVHYADIRSAIIVKNECETEGSSMYRKYHEWKIWFSKDITDRPCLMLT